MDERPSGGTGIALAQCKHLHWNTGCPKCPTHPAAAVHLLQEYELAKVEMLVQVIQVCLGVQYFPEIAVQGQHFDSVLN